MLLIDKSITIHTHQMMSSFIHNNGNRCCAVYRIAGKFGGGKFGELIDQPIDY